MPYPDNEPGEQRGCNQQRAHQRSDTGNFFIHLRRRRFADDGHGNPAATDGNPADARAPTKLQATIRHRPTSVSIECPENASGLKARRTKTAGLLALGLIGLARVSLADYFGMMAAFANTFRSDIHRVVLVGGRSGSGTLGGECILILF